MKYKVGDKVRLRDKEGLEKIKSQYRGVEFKPEVYELAGTECTIREVVAGGYVFDSSPWCWTEHMIEGLAEDLTHEEKSSEFPEAVLLNGADVMRALKQATAIPEETIKEAKKYDKRKKRMKELYKGELWSTEFECPDGYEFRDEKGNVIEAKKIVLEKKKPKYPQSYEECCKALGIEGDFYLGYRNETRHTTRYESSFQDKLCYLGKLLICRDAYWKIAGEKMGLGKPWKPDWRDSTETKYVIKAYSNDQIMLVNMFSSITVLAFPTEEMRDAFYENFKKLIEDCKELL